MYKVVIIFENRNLHTLKIGMSQVNWICDLIKFEIKIETLKFLKSVRKLRIKTK